jgi:hypothetical protein
MRAAWNSIGLEAMEIAMNVRRKWKSLTWFVAIVCGMAMTPALHAAVVYEYVSDQPSYTVSPGTFVNVLVYLRETLTAGSQSLITTDGGVFGAGMTLLRSAAGLPASPSSFVTDATGFTPNLTDFGGPVAFTGADGQGAASPSGIAFSVAVAPTKPTGTPLGNTGGGVSPSIANQVYLGTVKIMAGNTGPTTFSMRFHDASNGNTLTNNNFYDLDVNNNGGATPVYTGANQKTNSFTINVPEPGSFSLLLGAGVVMLARRRRGAAL